MGDCRFSASNLRCSFSQWTSLSERHAPEMYLLHETPSHFGIVFTPERLPKGNAPLCNFHTIFHALLMRLLQGRGRPATRLALCSETRHALHPNRKAMLKTSVSASEASQTKGGFVVTAMAKCRSRKFALRRRSIRLLACFTNSAFRTQNVPRCGGLTDPLSCVPRKPARQTASSVLMR